MSLMGLSAGDSNGPHASDGGILGAVDRSVGRAHSQEQTGLQQRAVAQQHLHQTTQSRLQPAVTMQNMILSQLGMLPNQLEAALYGHIGGGQVEGLPLFQAAQQQQQFQQQQQLLLLQQRQQQQQQQQVRGSASLVSSLPVAAPASLDLAAAAAADSALRGGDDGDVAAVPQLTDQGQIRVPLHQHQQQRQPSQRSPASSPTTCPALLLQDRNLLTPLHQACYTDCPPTTIAILLDESSYPGARRAAAVPDKLGRLPLHYAVCYGTNLDVVRLVLEANGAGAAHMESYKLVPLHLAYMALAVSKESRRLNLKRNKGGEEEEDDTEAVEDSAVAVKAGERDRTDKREEGDESKVEWESSEDGTAKVRGDGGGGQVDEEEMEHPECPGARHLWEKIVLILHALQRNSISAFSSSSSITSACFRVVHAASHFPCPPNVLRCAISLHPVQLRVRNECGDLPLHIASRQHRGDGCDEHHPWLPSGTNQKTSVYRHLEPEDHAVDNPISILVKGYPDAASAHDGSGRLPLNLALESGKRWVEGGVGDVVKAAPMALVTRDMKTHLFPFMIAAIGEINALDTVYRLLESNPMALSGGIETADGHGRAGGGKKRLAPSDFQPDDCVRGRTGTEKMDDCLAARSSKKQRMLYEK